MSEMGQLKPLELPEDPEDQEEEESDDGEEEKVPEGEIEKNSQQSDEPKIEDVIDSTNVKPSLIPTIPTANENDELEQLSQDIFENFGLCE